MVVIHAVGWVDCGYDVRSQPSLGQALCRSNVCMYDRSLISVVHNVGRGLILGLEKALDHAGDV